MMFSWNGNPAGYFIKVQDIVPLLPGDRVTRPYKTINLVSGSRKYRGKADRIIVKRNDFHLKRQRSIINFIPQINEPFAGTQNGCTNPDSSLFGISKALRFFDGLFRKFNNLFRTLIDGTPCGSQSSSLICTFNQFGSDNTLQLIHLVHNRSRGDI